MVFQLTSKELWIGEVEVEGKLGSDWGGKIAAATKYPYLYVRGDHII